MKAYLVLADDFTYDDWEGFVVLARSATQARQLAQDYADHKIPWRGETEIPTWADESAQAGVFLDHEQSTCVVIGDVTARAAFARAMVVLDSFNAG